MGRGRQKAKHTKVARELKYFTPDTNLTALERELAAGDEEQVDVTPRRRQPEPRHGPILAQPLEVGAAPVERHHDVGGFDLLPHDAGDVVRVVVLPRADEVHALVAVPLPRCAQRRRQFVPAVRVEVVDAGEVAALPDVARVAARETFEVEGEDARRDGLCRPRKVTHRNGTGRRSGDAA